MPGVAQEVSQEMEERSDGSVWYLGTRYDDLRAYHDSDVFHESGFRCGTESAMAMRSAELASRGSEELARSAADCTSALTNISPDYDPAPATTFTIPIWFHVIYNSSGTGNISDQRIADQIAALNDDFAGLGSASAINTTIQFELAGTTRTQNDTWFSTSNESLYKSALSVDPSQFLNVYTKDLSGGTLGFAYLPFGAAGSFFDGVVMLHNTIGGRNNGYSVFDQGRTLVHEVGHYLGLYHTFQSNGGSCLNSYSDGDLVVDTPPQSSPDFACSAGTSCGNSSALENFMNYSYDSCMDEFTAEQTNRMICSLVNYRPGAFSTSREGDPVEEEELIFGLPAWLLYEVSQRAGS